MTKRTYKDKIARKFMNGFVRDYQTANPNDVYDVMVKLESFDDILSTKLEVNFSAINKVREDRTFLMINCCYNGPRKWYDPKNEYRRNNALLFTEDLEHVLGCIVNNRMDTDLLPEHYSALNITILKNKTAIEMNFFGPDFLEYVK
jgi:hypothetical protein